MALRHQVEIHQTICMGTSSVTSVVGVKVLHNYGIQSPISYSAGHLAPRIALYLAYGGDDENVTLWMVKTSLLWPEA